MPPHLIFIEINELRIYWQASNGDFSKKHGVYVAMSRHTAPSKSVTG
jgi:hypothetical protein